MEWQSPGSPRSSRCLIPEAGPQTQTPTPPLSRPPSAQLGPCARGWPCHLPTHQDPTPARPLFLIFLTTEFFNFLFQKMTSPSPTPRAGLAARGAACPSFTVPISHRLPFAWGNARPPCSGPTIPWGLGWRLILCPRLGAWWSADPRPHLAPPLRAASREHQPSPLYSSSMCPLGLSGRKPPLPAQAEWDLSLAPQHRCGEPQHHCLGPQAPAHAGMSQALSDVNTGPSGYLAPNSRAQDPAPSTSTAPTATAIPKSFPGREATATPTRANRPRPAPSGLLWASRTHLLTPTLGAPAGLSRNRSKDLLSPKSRSSGSMKSLHQILQHTEDQKVQSPAWDT
nr:uncharacterized protein LOC129531872 [Gorilla gorilla gorilla]